MTYPKRYSDVMPEVERIRQHFAPYLGRRCLVVGNGPSAAKPPVLTAPMEDYVVFRCNWFFLEDQQRYGDRVDGFFTGVDEDLLWQELTRAIGQGRYRIGAVFQPFFAAGADGGVSRPLWLSAIAQFDHWAMLAANPTLARAMMTRPLPTQGVQAIALAAMLGFSEVQVIGVDLYSDPDRRYAWSLPERVERGLQRKDLTPDYERDHSRLVDLRFLSTVLAAYPTRLVGLASMPALAPLLSARLPATPVAPVARLASKAAQPRGEAPAKIDNVGHRAFVTLADLKYALAARILARSLAQVSDIPLIVMYTDERVRPLLQDLPTVQFRLVEEVRNPNRRNARKFGYTYTKLRMFELLDYERLVFLDADCLVLQSVDDLFDLEGIWAAPDWGDRLHSGFNSGVLAFSPNCMLRDLVFEAIATVDSADGGDQGMLNVVLADQINWLSPTYNTLKRFLATWPEFIHESEVKILHYTGDKPWDMNKFDGRFAWIEDKWARFADDQAWRHLFWQIKRRAVQSRSDRLTGSLPGADIVEDRTLRWMRLRRKWRKLWRTPGRFFTDALRNRFPRAD